MKRRAFIELLGLGAVAPAALAKETEKHRDKVSAELLRSKKLTSLFQENPKNTRALILCMEKYTKPGGEYDTAYIPAQVGKPFITYVIGSDNLSDDPVESVFVKYLWITFRNIIGSGDQTLYWRKKPALSSNGSCPKSIMSTRLRFEPYHTDNCTGTKVGQTFAQKILG